MASHRPPQPPVRGWFGGLAPFPSYIICGVSKEQSSSSSSSTPGMNGRQARPTIHSSTGDTPRSGAHTGTGRRTPPGHADMGEATLAAYSVRSGGSWRSGIRWSHIDHPPTPYKGMVWRSIWYSLLYNMRGFTAAASSTTTTWYEREAGAPAHSFQHRRYAS